MFTFHFIVNKNIMFNVLERVSGNLNDNIILIKAILYIALDNFRRSKSYLD